MDSAIIAFLDNQHILNIALQGPEGAYAANCFYRFYHPNMTLLCASQPKSYHVQLFQINPQVAGTIHNCTSRIQEIEGIQFRGSVRLASKEERDYYLQAFPLARFMGASYWAIELEWLKWTANRLGFGTKVTWTRRSSR
ncbi:MAG: hypothetical protein C6I00_05820 [Nitratiruptor sp.]|nr:hypothetical protein [Nitratiruptor sp.]NPA83616.1 hypothetical protein [Campylobacterota bacterium]